MFGVETSSGGLPEGAYFEVQKAQPINIDKTVASKKKYPNLLFVFVTQMVASAMEVEASEIQSLSRGNAKLCRARQIAMYLMNVVLACAYKDIGKYFDRDRTTVSYACSVIEELRDDPAFDDRIGELEEILSTVLQLLPKQVACEQ